jgi:hypothetical protein
MVLGLAGLLCLAPLGARAQESWDAVYMGGAKVGSIHTTVTPVKDRGRDLLRVRVDMKFQFKRLKDQVRIETMYGTIETLEGSVLRLDTRTLAAQQEMRTFGDVVNNEMTLTLEGSGQSQKVKMPWGPEVRGPYAAEQSLSRSRMKTGETRELRMYVPDLSKICDVKLEAKDEEPVRLGDGKRTLLRIDETVKLDGRPLPEYAMTHWVDAGGQVLKSHGEMLGGMDVYRTTKDGALAMDAGHQLDLTLKSIIKVPRRIAKPETTRDITYRLGMKGDPPSTVVPADRRQSLGAGSTNDSAVLTVKTAGPQSGNAGEQRVDDKYLLPNALITSDDPVVRKHAVAAVADAVDPWDRAVRITKWVAKNLTKKNFQTAFAPAGEVAQTLAGDCTEHGVLVAAMCRAVGVPARVVVGLVYSDQLGGFGFHMWNEVYVNRRWVAVDAAFDQTDVDAVHIKLADAALEGVSPYESFLAVVRVMGKLSIEPLEIR